MTRRTHLPSAGQLFAIANFPGSERRISSSGIDCRFPPAIPSAVAVIDVFSGEVQAVVCTTTAACRLAASAFELGLTTSKVSAPPKRGATRTGTRRLFHVFRIAFSLKPSRGFVDRTDQEVEVLTVQDKIHKVMYGRIAAVLSLAFASSLAGA